MFISCKIAALLLEKKQLLHLNWKERFQLRLHHHLCKACVAYRQQSFAVDNLLNRHFGVQAKNNQDIMLNENLKLRIISELGKL